MTQEEIDEMIENAGRYDETAANDLVKYWTDPIPIIGRLLEAEGWERNPYCRETFYKSGFVMKMWGNLWQFTSGRRIDAKVTTIGQVRMLEHVARMGSEIEA